MMPPFPVILTLAWKVVILIHWTLAGSAKDKWHLADDAASFGSPSEIFYHSRKVKKCPLSYAVTSPCLLTFCYLNNLRDGGKKVHGY